VTGFLGNLTTLYWETLQPWPGQLYTHQAGIHASQGLCVHGAVYADEDRKLVDLRRGDQMKAGFALQLVTVRWLGTFVKDPLDVPGEVLDFVAGSSASRTRRW
jgi:hypothetical protein